MPSVGCSSTGARLASSQQPGVRMVVVHGRTRAQFYTGRANWAAIRAVRDAMPDLPDYVWDEVEGRIADRFGPSEITVHVEPS